MSIIDASGPIYKGMWSYGEPFPQFRLKELGKPEWIEKFHPRQQAFEGFHMLTGSYISCPAHAFGIEETYAAHEVPLERLFNVDAYVFNLDLNTLGREGNRPYIALENIRETGVEDIPEGVPVLFGTGWGTHWQKQDFLSHAWFFRRDAVEYLVEKKPFMLGGDTPYFDNIENEQGNWELICGNNIIILAPLVNLEKIQVQKVRLFVAPLNILHTYGLPCRVLIDTT